MVKIYDSHDLAFKICKRRAGGMRYYRRLLPEVNKVCTRVWRTHMREFTLEHIHAIATAIYHVDMLAPPGNVGYESAVRDVEIALDDLGATVCDCPIVPPDSEAPPGDQDVHEVVFRSIQPFTPIGGDLIPGPGVW